MKPLIWDIPDDFKERNIMDYNWRERKTDNYIFMGGKCLPCPDVGGLNYSKDPKEYDLIFASRVSPKEFTKFDCLPNNSTALLVNQKVLDILNKLCTDDIQAFPATIMPDKSFTGNFKNHDYWLINITKTVDPIDHANTEFSYTPKSLGGDIIGAKKIRFLDVDISGIARNQLFSSLKIVSASLAQAFKESKVTGVQFIEDKDY
jgi:hypothetical protein